MTRVAFGCVAEPEPRFYGQALRLVRSLRWFGGTLARADIFVCFVGEPDPARRAELEALGALVRVVEPFNPRNRFSNKVRFLELPELAGYETAALLDCDVAVVQDPAPFLRQPALQLMMADLPTVPSERLAWLCERFGLPAPEPLFRTTCSDEPTVWYCNTGVTILPTAWIPRVLPRWRDYILRLCAEPELLDPPYAHCNQAAMALVFAADPLPFAELPVAMNFPLHQTGRRPTEAMLRADPVILHYHDRVGPDGLLLPVPYPLAQARVEQLNARLRALAAGEARAGRRPRRAARPSAARALRRRGPGRAVCVTGMHRAGTSLVAQLLHRCGVWMGPAAALAEPADDNLDGYWEHPAFHALDEAVLAHLGGGWDLPPSPPPGWEGAPELAGLRARARALVARARRRARWGWKDPRSALTMPLWRRAAPGLRVVVCVRSPLDVARSLARRGMSSLPFGLRLWQTYYERLLDSVPREARVVTRYDAFFEDAPGELRRVLAALGLPAPEGAVERACLAVAGELRHQRGAAAELTAVVPDSVLALYARLCEEAGAAAAPPGGAGGAPLAAGLAPAILAGPAGDAERLAAAAALLREREAALARARTDLAVLEPILAAREAELAALRPILAAREAELVGHARELASVRGVLAAREEEIAAYARELASVRGVLAAREEEIAAYARELASARGALAVRPELEGGAARWEEIPGWFQWRSAQEEAAAFFPDGSRIVEVGTYLGRSLCSLGEAARAAGRRFSIVGVDTCRGSGPEGPRQRDYHGAAVAQGGGSFAGALHRNLIGCGLDGDVALLVADSLSAAALFADGSLDWVHLDARHDYASVVEDIRAWLPKLRPGGWLSGDDYDPEKWPDVVRAVADTLPGARAWSGGQWRWVVE